MAVETWLTFVLFSVGILAAPGPVAILAVNYALDLPFSRAALIIPGAVLGDFVAMTVSLLGVGLLLSVFPAFFFALKLVGASVLIGLGIFIVFHVETTPIADAPKKAASAHQVFWSGFVLTALHPAGFVFFASLTPQFITETKPFLPQALIMTATFLVLGAVTAFGWLLSAGYLVRLLKNGKVVLLMRKASGLLLLALGVGAMIF